MKTFKTRTQSEQDKINFFKELINENIYSDTNIYQSIYCCPLFESYRNNISQKKNLILTDLLSFDDMLLYIIAWKQILPEIEKTVRKNKEDFKEYMRNYKPHQYLYVKRYSKKGLETLYNFRHEIKIYSRNKNKKTLSK